MQKNQDPRWPKFWWNLIWFVATLIVLVILLRFLRSPIILMALWGVGLVWGGLLAFKLSQLFFHSDQIVMSDERSLAYLEQALDYKKRIRQVVESTAGPASREYFKQIVPQIDALTEAVEALVVRIGTLRRNEVIRRDLQVVPQAIKELEARLSAERTATVRNQLIRTLTNRRKQLEALEALQNSVKQAEIQIESTLSQLGTIYSQLLTGQSTSQVADYSRLASDIDEEVRLLQDHLEALREVKWGES